MRSLVIIDVQIDFMPSGSLEVPSGDRIVPVINDLQAEFDLVVATQDWHPVNHVSFASNHPGKRPFEQIDLDGALQTLWPDHCVQESRGAMFHPDLLTGRIAAIFRKGMDPRVDSYSGFYDNNHQISTGLSGYLKEKGADDLYFCGLASDICVYYTIQDALREGFSATLIEDASQPLDTATFEILKKELTEHGARILSARDLP
jgi:nicotinamidase/pyrazinamidase